MIQIKVPDIPSPTKGKYKDACWEQSKLMERCTLKKGHKGPHSWG